MTLGTLLSCAAFDITHDVHPQESSFVYFELGNIENWFYLKSVTTDSSYFVCKECSGLHLKIGEYLIELHGHVHRATENVTKNPPHHCSGISGTVPGSLYDLVVDTVSLHFLAYAAITKKNQRILRNIWKCRCAYIIYITVNFHAPIFTLRHLFTYRHMHHKVRQYGKPETMVAFQHTLMIFLSGGVRNTGWIRAPYAIYWHIQKTNGIIISFTLSYSVLRYNTRISPSHKVISLHTQTNTQVTMLFSIINGVLIGQIIHTRWQYQCALSHRGELCYYITYINIALSLETLMIWH